MSTRLDRVRARMGELGVDALLLSLGPDLPWLTGYEGTPLERLTMLVLPADSDATLVVPRLEAPRVEPPGWVVLRPWEETEDPIGIVAGLVGAAESLAVSDQTWSRFVLALQAALPRARWRHCGSCCTPRPLCCATRCWRGSSQPRRGSLPRSTLPASSRRPPPRSTAPR